MPSEFPLFIKGIVVRGRGQGKSVLNCPTANLEACVHLDFVEKLGLGVFGGFASVGDDKTIYQMVCSIGRNETLVQRGPLTIVRRLLFDFCCTFSLTVLGSARAS